MSSVEEVMHKLHAGGEPGQDLKSCSHATTDCPHGDNINQANIPWASDTSKAKDNTDGNGTQRAAQGSGMKEGTTDTEAKYESMSYVTENINK